jgi:glycosyltransferase involved in cell wall biosynthesis
MRIAFDARHIGDFGIGTYIRNLIKSFARIGQENEYVLVCLPANERDFKSLPQNFRVVPWRLTDRDWNDNFAFPAFLGKLRADLHHIPLNRVPLLMRRPYVVTIHDMSRHVFPEHSGLAQQISIWKSRRGLMRAESVMTVSAATRRDIENVLGVPHSRIKLIYNAIDNGFLRASQSDRNQRRRLLERYGVNYPYLLYAGNIRPQKNIPRLIEAFAVLRSELANHPEYNAIRLLVIGGDISQQPAVRLAANRSGSSGFIRFFGFVPQETLLAFYESASAFVFPSLYEGFGLPPLEAMAAGTPVLASNASSLPEVVGDAALLVNPENVFEIARGLKEILVDQDLRVSLVALGFKNLERFSWDQTAAAVLATYREAAALVRASSR